MDAAQGAGFVRAALPEELVATGMTREASTVLFFSRVIGIFAEGDGHSLSAASLDMRFPRTVARLATPFFV
jgi:hypothetical protein